MNWKKFIMTFWRRWCVVVVIAGTIHQVVLALEFLRSYDHRVLNIPHILGLDYWLPQLSQSPWITVLILVGLVGWAGWGAWRVATAVSSPS